MQISYANIYRVWQSSNARIHSPTDCYGGMFHLKTNSTAAWNVCNDRWRSVALAQRFNQQMANKIFFFFAFFLFHQQNKVMSIASGGVTQHDTNFCVFFLTIKWQSDERVIGGWGRGCWWDFIEISPEEKWNRDGWRAIGCSSSRDLSFPLFCYKKEHVHYQPRLIHLLIVYIWLADWVNMCVVY